MERSVVSNCIGGQPGDIELSQEEMRIAYFIPNTCKRFGVCPQLRSKSSSVSSLDSAEIRAILLCRSCATNTGFGLVPCSAFLVSPFADSHSARSSRDEPGSTGILRFASSISRVHSDSRNDYTPSAGSRRTICSSRSASSIFLSRRHLLMRGKRTAIPERCRDDR